MNNINSIKLNGITKELGNKKEVVKETIQEVAQEIKTQTSNLGRDLVKTVGEDSPNISLSNLLKDGYKLGRNGIVFKMDDKKDLYKAFQFDKEKLSNITIQETLPIKQHVIVTQKVDNGKWISISDYGKKSAIINGDPSEKTLQKATELQFDGYKISAQDEKSLTLIKDNHSVNISKSSGKEIE